MGIRLTLVLLTLPLAASAATPTTLTLAERDIRIPTPAGFGSAHALEHLGDLDREDLRGPMMLFLPHEDIRALTEGGETTSGRFFTVQRLAQDSQGVFLEADFEHLKTRFRDEWQLEFARRGISPDDVANLVRHSMLTLMHAQVEEQVTEAVPLPVLVDEPRMIATGHVFIQRGPDDLPGQLAVEISAVAFVFVRNRVVLATGEAPYHGQEDVDAFSDALTDWGAGIVAGNPPAFTDRFDAGSPRWALPGFLLLILMSAALVWYIRR